MPLKSTKNPKQKPFDKSKNCTKISSENVTDGGDEDVDAEGNEFLKATKVFHGYLARCGLSKVLTGALTELLKNQKDIADPTLFMKTYLEVAMGTGKDFDKLKQIFGDLSSALIKVDSVVAKVRVELEGTKEFVDRELDQLRTSAGAASALSFGISGTSGSSKPSGGNRPTGGTSERPSAGNRPTGGVGGTSERPSAGNRPTGGVGGTSERASAGNRPTGGVGGTSERPSAGATIDNTASFLADMSLEEKQLAEKITRVEEGLRHLEATNGELRDAKRVIDELRQRLEIFGDRMKEGLVMTSVDDVALVEGGAIEAEAEEAEDAQKPGISYNCNATPSQEDEEGEEGGKKRSGEEETLGHKAGGGTTKVVKSRAGANDNIGHKAGGGKTKVFDEKLDYSNVKSKAGANDNIAHKAGGGTTKVFNEKLDYSNVKSKAGANDNLEHKAGGGTTNVFNEKLDYSKVQSKAGANDNIDHKAAGGTTKVFNEKQDYTNVQSRAGANENIGHKAAGGTTKVFNEKQDYTNVKSRAGANDNIKHKPAGGDKKIFDEKVVYK